MLFKCGSNNVSIAEGVSGPIGYECAFSEQYLSDVQTADYNAAANDYIKQNDGLTDFILTLPVGKWLVRAQLQVGNRSAIHTNPSALQLRLDGSGAGIGTTDKTVHTYGSASEFYANIITLTAFVEVTAGTKDLSIYYSVPNNVNEVFIYTRSLAAFKMTNVIQVAI